MSQVGFYRYKTLADTEKTVSIYINNVLDGTKTVKPIEVCDGSMIIKYLDKNGQYRFYPFNKYYETIDTPEHIGEVNRFISDIYTDQSDKQNVGYNNTRKIYARADVPNEHLEKLIDLYSSPRVFLYIGTTSDLASDWLEVKVKANPAIIKRRKANEGRIDLEITLPKNYSITML